jgi:cell wall assembly regulator SMI1/predicted DNA-binding WGR domain protein
LYPEWRVLDMLYAVAGLTVAAASGSPHGKHHQDVAERARNSPEQVAEADVLPHWLIDVRRKWKRGMMVRASKGWSARGSAQTLRCGSNLMSETQSFEFDDGSSSKFWAISVSGKTHTVHYGRIGTKGQKRTKVFATSHAAAKDAERLIAQKSKKGYRPVTVNRAKTPQKPRMPSAIKYRTKKSLGSDSVDDAWKRIEAWLATYLPDTYKSLCPPAKAREIKAFEEAVRLKLPDDLKQSYRRHNGQEYVSAGIIFGLPLLPLGEAQSQWKPWSGYDRSKKTKYNFDDEASCFPVDFVQPVYFTRNWIPISHDSGGNHIAIDMSPGELGAEGQVIVCGRDDTFHPVLALSWAQFLTDVADELERGNWNIEYHESEDDYEFNLGVPRNRHFHNVGANWSRCKLGLRELSSDDEAIWKQRARN